MEKDPKTLDVKDSSDLKAKVSDVKVEGNPDAWQLVCKASSQKQGWMKSTKAMNVVTGCLVQVTTQQYDNISEALAFVPGTFFVDGIFTTDRPVGHE